MNKRPYIYLPIFFALVLILGIVLGTFLIPAFTSKNGLFSFDFEDDEKIQAIISYVENEYVDSLSKEDLMNYAINGLLQQLDPHSAYISAEDFNQANDPLKGNFDGIGIQFRIIRDSITVIGLISGGPSEKEGLLPGDRIITIDGQKAAGVKITNDEAIKKLKGPRGSVVKVGVWRKDARKMLSFKITRGNIATSTIDFSYMVSGNVGYVKLSGFSATTTPEFLEATNKLRSLGMTKLILDLRGNGGGILESAVEIADEFLGGEELIVYTKGYHRRQQSHYSGKGGTLKDVKLAVLIDEFSASAAEILAGALQDNDRAVIVGRRSFGKGLVQEQELLPDGSALRLTVARYYTPTGRCIQKPYTDDVDQYYMDFYKQFMTEEEYQDSVNFSDTTRYTTPQGKIVYGGGGIMPDEYVSAKSEFSTDYYKSLLSKGAFQNYAFDYVDRHRAALSKYGSASAFLSDFQLTPVILEEFLVFAQNAGVPRNESQFKTSEKIIRAELKGQIGRLVYDEAAFFPIVLPEDKVYQKALEKLK
jgi:carboxyl-terminal processing protease